MNHIEDLSIDVKLRDFAQFDYQLCAISGFLPP